MNDDEARYEVEARADAEREAYHEARLRELAEGFYLGDGLYASFDGYQIMLKTRRMEGEHYVALEPQVLLAFVKYAQEFFPTLMAATKASEV